MGWFLIGLLNAVPVAACLALMVAGIGIAPVQALVIVINGYVALYSIAMAAVAALRKAEAQS